MDITIAAFLGRLLGTMIDPITWAPPIALVWTLRSKAWFVPVIYGVCATFAIVLVLAGALRSSDPNNPRNMMFAVMAAAVWAIAATGVVRWMRRR